MDTDKLEQIAKDINTIKQWVVFCGALFLLGVILGAIALAG